MFFHQSALNRQRERTCLNAFVDENVVNTFIQCPFRRCSERTFLAMRENTSADTIWTVVGALPSSLNSSAVRVTLNAPPKVKVFTVLKTVWLVG